MKYLLSIFFALICFNADAAFYSNAYSTNKWPTLYTNTLGGGYVYVLPTKQFEITKTRLIYEGDSLSGCCGWVYYVTNYPQFNHYLSFSNAALGGATLTNIMADYATQIYPNAPAAPTQAILHVFIGAGDWAIADPFPYFSALSNYWQTARNDGFIVVAFTVPPSIYWNANSTRSSNHFVLNKLIRESTNWNYLIDVDLMFPDYNSSNYVDGVHFSASAYQAIAGEVDYVLNNGPRNDSWIGGQMAYKESTNLIFRTINGQPLMTLNTAGITIPYTPGGLDTSASYIKSGKHFIFYGGNFSTIEATPVGGLKFYNAANYDFQTYSFASGLIESRLFITNSGNVGIGFTNPVQALSVLGNISSSGAGYFTNGVFVFAPTNGVAPPTTVTQPIGMFGSIMMNTTNSIGSGSANVYNTVTNYTIARTNGFTVNLATGFLTNVYAGFYRITVYLSSMPGNGDTLEAEVFLNETEREEIALFATYDNPARIRTASATGVLYIPSGTGISFRVNNRTDTDNITVWRCALTVGTP